MNNLRILETYYKSFANNKRLQILAFLRRSHAATVSDIAESVHLKLKSTSKHLLILEKAQIVERQKKGLFVYYSLSKKQGPVLRNVLTLL